MEETEQKITPEEAKRDEMINEYIRREAIIKSKFPDILEAPKSIQEEYSQLSAMIHELRVSSMGETWGKTIASDGCAIDKFVAQKYESALARFATLKNQNEEYITREEEETFEFPEVNFDELKMKIDSVQTFDERRAVFNELTALSSEPLPETTITKIHELTTELSKKEIQFTYNKKEETDKPIPVNQSKFSQIFQKAKGRLKGIVENLKDRFNNKERENTNELEDKSDEAR